MKINYNREQDILLLESSSEPIDYAEETGPLIVHFSKEGKIVLLEILDASDFLSEIIKKTISSKESASVELAF